MTQCIQLGNPTEIPRPQARNTAYVGTLKDGKTQGFCYSLASSPARRLPEPATAQRITETRQPK